MTDAPTPLQQRIATDIAAEGPMPFSRFMELALYEPVAGFYSQGGQAGRRGGDFITSVETGPLFGAVIARHLDSIWHSLGSPAEFLVAEAGAGVGTLYRTVHAANPECFGALTWTLVEQSEQLRTHHNSLPAHGWASQSSLPDARQHLVLANELLDNLPFDIAERTDHGWNEARVHLEPDAPSGFALAPSGPLVTTEVPVEASAVAPGTQVPLMRTAVDWVGRARSIADQVVMFDYAATTVALAGREQSGWLRTYREQQRGADPLLEPGSWDITADVAWDQFGPETVVTNQASWLYRAGIGELVENARAEWAERAHIGDLSAMMARSAVTEAEALTAPNGLGGFSVLEWVGTTAG